MGKQNSQLLAVVERVARRAASILIIDELLQATVDDIRKSLGYYNVALLLLDRKTGELHSQAMAGGLIEYSSQTYRQPIAIGLMGAAVQAGETIACGDVLQDPRYFSGFPVEIPTRSELCMPIMFAGETIAVLDIQETKKNAFDKEDVKALKTLADQLAVAINNAQLYDRARREIAERTLIEEKLRASEMRISTILRTVPVAVYTARVPSEEDATWVSESVERFTGYPAERFVNTPHFWTEHIHPGDRERVARDYRLGIASGAVRLEYRFLVADGTYRWMLDDALALPGGTGPLTDSIGIFMDISERKRAEEDRLHLERQMLHAQKLESLGVLAGGIAHDFNNLLLAIIGNLEIARLEHPSMDVMLESVSAAEKAAHRAAELTNQLLAYAGKGKLATEEIDVSALIDETSRLLAASISKSVSFTLHLGRRLPHITGDVSQIQQVAMNLMVNAAEAIGTNPGGVTVTTFSRRFEKHELDPSRIDEKPPAGTFVVIQVLDTGCGMSAEVLERIFEPFFSTKFTGRGLGLPAVIGVVRSHGGAIMVESKPGKGSTFTVLFPACERSAAALREAAGEAPGSRSVLSGRVLLVDDEELVRTTSSGLLKHIGLTAVPAASGAEALEIARERAAELACAIVDMTMPGMDSADLVAELLRLRPDLKIILSSGYQIQSISSRTGALGIAGFIQKPYRLDELRAVLEEALAGK